VLRADFTIAADFCVDSQSSLPKIPSLIIGGSCDVITPPASLLRLGRCLQKSPVSVIEGAGHMVIYEKNEELRKKVSEFLGKVNKPG
jgi:pimeloyl-ACP methyl ester carboxylesterase